MTEFVVTVRQRLRAVTGESAALRMGLTPGSTWRRTVSMTVGTILCIGVALACFGCGPGNPSDYSIAPPVVAFDAQGNVLVAYQMSEGGRYPITYVQKLTLAGDRLWGEKGVRLDDREPEHTDYPPPTPLSTRIVVGQDGDSTVFWTYEDEISATELDASGGTVWEKKGLVGGAFEKLGRKRWDVVASSTITVVVWIDRQGNLNLQSMDGNGGFLWPEQPQIAGASDFGALCDEDGDTWLMWIDASTGAIYLQVFDRGGKTVWAEAEELKESGQSSAQGAGTSMYQMWLARAADDKVIAAWRGYEDSEWRGAMEIRTVSIDGEALVSAAEVFFEQNATATVPAQMSDGQGGLFAFWADGYMIRAQLIDSRGGTVWGENGLVVAGELGEKSQYSMSSDQAGGAILSWTMGEENARRVQRIDAEGNLLWPGDGITISTTPEVLWWYVATKDGAAVFSGLASQEPPDHAHLQKVDADGSLPWGPNGIRLDDWRESNRNAGE